MRVRLLSRRAALYLLRAGCRQSPRTENRTPGFNRALGPPPQRLGHLLRRIRLQPIGQWRRSLDKTWTNRNRTQFRSRSIVGKGGCEVPYNNLVRAMSMKARLLARTHDARPCQKGALSSTVQCDQTVAFRGVGGRSIDS